MNPANILLVDDRPENLLALEAVLAPLGAHLLQAHSGEAALALARSHDCAAVLLDVQMPGMDGFQTAARLREQERTHQAPILFITAAQADDRQVARGYALGAVDFVLKPFRPEVLRSKVAAYIDLFEQTQRLQEQVLSAVTLEERINVLVVNDNLASLLAAEVSLLKLGVQVHVVAARSGREALSLLLKQSFALILLDVHMPDMDGFELAAMLRENERCRHIPLVFITATMKAEADVTAGYACGALDFVFTPISAELLCGKVSAILNQFRQQPLLARSLAEITDLHRVLRTFASELENANATLEQRVQERTAELVKTNAALQAEIAARARAQASLQESLGEKQSLLKEIHHRVKNNLQIVSSLLRLQAGQIDSPIAKAALLDRRNRVRSMALIHEHLYRSSNLATVDVAAYLKSLCHQLFQALLATPNTVQLHLDLAPLRLDIDQAIPCGLLVNELVSNALKHAFPEARTGEVRVEFQPVTGGPDWCLCVADNGVGLTPDFALDRCAALGLQLVSDLTSQLGGRLAIGSGPGAVFAVTFTPASQPTEPPCRKSPQDTAPQDCRPPGAAEPRPQEPDL